MLTETMEAQNAARNFLRQFKSLVILSEALEKCGDIDNEINSLRLTKEGEKKQLNALKEEKAALQQNVEELPGRIEELKAEVNAVTNNLEEKKKASEAFFKDLKRKFAEEVSRHEAEIDALKKKIDYLNGEKDRIENDVMKKFAEIL